jgi:quercetin dioxygenase-like cupin family protein
MTPCLRRAIEYAIEESQQVFAHNYVGTEHLLIGLLREPEGHGGRVLREAGIGLEEARVAVRKTLSTAYVAPARPAEAPGPRVVGPAEGEVFSVLGTRTRMILRRTQTQGAATIFEQMGQPGEGVPLHVHKNEDELFQVMEGQMKFTIDKVDHMVPTGGVVYGPRNIAHAWFIAGDAPGRLRVTILPGTRFEEMIDELGRLPAGPPDFALVTAICSRYDISFVH